MIYNKKSTKTKFTHSFSEFAEDSCFALSEMQLTYTISAECDGEFPSITLKAENYGVEEDSWTIVIKECSKNFPVLNPEEIYALFDDFRKRFEMNVTSEKKLKKCTFKEYDE